MHLFPLIFVAFFSIHPLFVNSGVIKDPLIETEVVASKPVIIASPEDKEIKDISEPESEESNVGGEVEVEEEGKKAPSIDDRINLNFQNAHSNAFGPGGFSNSHANSHLFQAGLYNRHTGYRPIANYGGSNSGGFSSGPFSPHTNAFTNSGRYGGLSGAGFRGGPGTRGHAFAHGIHQKFAVPVDPFGTVLLSNFKEPTKKDPSKDVIDPVDKNAQNDDIPDDPDLST